MALRRAMGGRIFDRFGSCAGMWPASL